MRLTFVLAALLGLSAPAGADVALVLDKHILPGFDNFAVQSQNLAEAAQDDCTAQALAPAYQATFDAWMPVSGLFIGPSETGALSVAFWPDKRGFTKRSLSQMIAAEDPIAFDPAGYADVSIAARGLFALDMLLFDPDLRDYSGDGYACALVQAVTADLARQGAELAHAWREDFATTLTSAGEPGNTTYLTPDEAFRAIYTQLMSSLEFTADQRIARPMGSFERPRPTLAEAWRSGRSLRNVTLSVDAAEDMALLLADSALPLSRSAVKAVQDAASRIKDPGFQDVEEPEARLRLEILQQAVNKLRDALEQEVGVANGITAGFNSQDGD